jgi:sensor histidine kinase YesM
MQFVKNNFPYGISRFSLIMHLGRTITRYKLHHLLIWTIFGTIWFYLRYQDYTTTGIAVMVTLIKTFDLALMVYTANYFLIPQLLYRKHYVLFAVAFLSMIVVSSISKMYILGYITENPSLLNWSGKIKSRIYDNMIPHLFLVIAGVSFQLLFDYNRIQKRLAEVARERAEAELNFLKSQINPHFVFNSLNSVYFLIDKNNTEARRALHKFSEMLRYQLYELKNEKIPIEKEIGFLEDYIGLQQLRNENCTIRLRIDSEMKSFSIEPLLLIPFVENSFKHLSHFNNGSTNEVDINLCKKNGSMKFHVRNTTEGSAGKEIHSSGGIGLANVKRRLELLYPQKHELKTWEQDGWFDVSLTIKMEN